VNKHGEIVFGENGQVIEINGYDGNRKSFEYIELSEYYQKVEELEHQLHLIQVYINDMKTLLRDLT
jgi:hypothetical protein